MGIHRVTIPEEHRDIIDDLQDKDGNSLLLSQLRREMKRQNDEFWKAIKAAIPETKDVEEALHYIPGKHEIYWID